MVSSSQKSFFDYISSQWKAPWGQTWPQQGPRWTAKLLVGSVQHFKKCTETFRLLRGMGCPQAVRTLGVQSAPCHEVHTGSVYPGVLQKMTHSAKGGRVENGACDRPVVPR